MEHFIPKEKTLERSSARFHQQKEPFLFELTGKDFFFFTKNEAKIKRGRFVIGYSRT